MARFTYIPALVLGLATCSPATTPLPPVTAPAVPGASQGPGADRAVATITVADVQRHIAFIASDELRGRDTPSPGLETAADYLADQFRGFGLEPAGDDASFIQRWPYGATVLDARNVVFEARGPQGATEPRYGRDYFVLPATIDSVAGEPIFIGRARPGMQPPAGAGGRIVMTFLPDTGGAGWQQALAAAFQAGAAAGAAGLVFILDPAYSSDAVATISGAVSSQLAPLPIIAVRHDVIAPVFASAGLDLPAIRGRTDGVTSPLAGVRMRIRTPVLAQQAEPPNVVAVLRGSDPVLRDEYIVYSAHFDHVGVGTPINGDSIYNGADDNASGTTGLLEIAEAFAALPAPPARSVLFALVSGEEKGLFGSAHFVEEPPVPVAQMVANINVDMIGRNAPDTVVAIGQDYSSLGPRTQAVVGRHPELGLVVAPDLWPDEQLFFRSDHFNFARKEIPAIFFTTGLHPQYHHPADEPGLIDADKLTRVARLLFRLGYDLAMDPVKPTWTPAGLQEVRRHTGN